MRPIAELRCKCGQTAAASQRDHLGGSSFSPSMPPLTEGRGRNFCVWLISFLLFFVILAGGAFLVLYITLPESEHTVWFPMAGMILVGIPWSFWFLTCIYRCITVRCGGDRPPVKAVALAPAGGGATAGAGDSPVGSPNGARKVRFGGATATGDAGASSDRAAGASGAPAGGGDSVDKIEGSSLNLRESEVPLAFSISS